MMKPQRLSTLSPTPLVAVLLAASLFLCLPTMADTIHVNTRNDLNSLASTITNAVLDGGKEIDVVFAPGTFTYRDNLLNLSNKQWRGVRLRFIGNGAKLMAEGPAITNHSTYDHSFQPTYTYATTAGHVLSPWGDMLQTDRLIEVVDEGQKLCRLHCGEALDMPASDCRNTWINLSQWYTSSVYKVERISGGWIYFTADNLAYNTARKCYNVNLDYGYARMMPRFRLCNSAGLKTISNAPSSASDTSALPSVSIRGGIMYLPDSISSVRECQAIHFLRMKNTALQSLSIEGLTFLGNKESTDYLLAFTSVRSDSLVIRSCSFIGLGSGAVSSQQTDNLILSSCSFSDCRRYGIYVEGGANPRITQNSFTRMGLALLNSFCIRVSATNFLISENHISDFGYGAIAVGKWWAAPKSITVSGTVEQNVIHYSPQWLSHILGHSLMDSGAIYLYTQMDDVRVRHNFIYDYTGACDNRGIFCDDGAKNFTIEGNIILHTPNSFSIDSRRTLSIETNPRSHTKEVNVNNTITSNLIDGSIRFQGRDDNARCRLERNIFLHTGADSAQTNVLDNLSLSAPFVSATYQGISNGLVRASAATLRLIRGLPSWPYIRRFMLY